MRPVILKRLRVFVVALDVKNANVGQQRSLPWAAGRKPGAVCTRVTGQPAMLGAAAPLLRPTHFHFCTLEITVSLFFWLFYS